MKSAVMYVSTSVKSHRHTHCPLAVDNPVPPLATAQGKNKSYVDQTLVMLFLHSTQQSHLLGRRQELLSGWEFQLSHMFQRRKESENDLTPLTVVML